MLCQWSPQPRIHDVASAYVADQVSIALNYTEYIDQTRYTSKDVARNIAIADDLLTARLFDNRLNSQTPAD